MNPNSFILFSNFSITLQLLKCFARKPANITDLKLTCQYPISGFLKKFKIGRFHSASNRVTKLSLARRGVVSYPMHPWKVKPFSQVSWTFISLQLCEARDIARERLDRRRISPTRRAPDHQGVRGKLARSRPHRPALTRADGATAPASDTARGR